MESTSKLRLFGVVVAATTASYYLIHSLFAVTIGGTGQLTDYRYALANILVFAWVAYLGQVIRRPFLPGLVFGIAMFCLARILRIHQGFEWMTLYMDVVHDFGFGLLPPALANGYLRTTAGGAATGRR